MDYSTQPLESLRAARAAARWDIEQYRELQGQYLSAYNRAVELEEQASKCVGELSAEISRRSIREEQHAN